MSHERILEKPNDSMRGPIITAVIGLLLLSATVTWSVLHNGSESARWNVTVAGSSVWVVAVFGAMVWGAVIVQRKHQYNGLEAIVEHIDDRLEGYEKERVQRGYAILDGIEVLRGEGEVDRGRVVAMVEQLSARLARLAEIQERMLGMGQPGVTPESIASPHYQPEQVTVRRQDDRTEIVRREARAYLASVRDQLRRKRRRKGE